MIKFPVLLDSFEGLDGNGVASYFEAHLDETDEVLLAYYDTSDYQGTAYVLFRDIGSNKLYEVHGSHCSCYGLEGQWSPEETSIKALEHWINNGSGVIDNFRNQLIEIVNMLKNPDKQLEELATQEQNILNQLAKIRAEKDRINSMTPQEKLASYISINNFARNEEDAKEKANEFLEWIGGNSELDLAKTLIDILVR